MVEWRYATLRYARMNRLNPIENAPPYFVPDLYVFEHERLVARGRGNCWRASEQEGPARVVSRSAQVSSHKGNAVRDLLNAQHCCVVYLRTLSQLQSCLSTGFEQGSLAPLTPLKL